MGRNGNRLHRNGSEWECKKPFPGISNMYRNVFTKANNRNKQMKQGRKQTVLETPQKLLKCQKKPHDYFGTFLSTCTARNQRFELITHNLHKEAWFHCINVLFCIVNTQQSKPCENIITIIIIIILSTIIKPTNKMPASKSAIIIIIIIILITL